DVTPPLGLAQQILGPAADDLDAMPQKLLQHLLETERSRPAVHQGQQNDAHRLLQRRELIQLIQHQLGVGVALDVGDEAHGLAAAGTTFVADGSDALDTLVLDQLANGLGQAVARLLERHLADDDLAAAALLADVGAGAERDPAAPVPVAVENPLAAAD